MGSTSTLAAWVRVEILSPWFCQHGSDSSGRTVVLNTRREAGGDGTRMFGHGETWTHGDLNALVGEDEGGVGGSELGRLGRSARFLPGSARERPTHHLGQSPV